MKPERVFIKILIEQVGGHKWVARYDRHPNPKALELLAKGKAANRALGRLRVLTEALYAPASEERMVNSGADT